MIFSSLKVALTELPFGMKGKIFRSAMPFGTYDPEGEILEEYQVNNVSVVVSLASVEECEEKAKRNLHQLYEKKGFVVVSLPVEDFAAPRKDAMADLIDNVISHAAFGRNVVVHCSAGRGRTGTFMACLAITLLGLSGEEAIAWTREYIPGAVETPEQEDLVREYTPKRKSLQFT